MRWQNIKNLPVLSDDELIGIVTHKDITEVYPSKATVLDLEELYHLTRNIKEITDVIRKFGVKMISVLSSYTTDKNGRRHVFTRTDNTEEKK